jgi:carbon-monoxide dehydrogenase large subunit
MPGVEAVLTGRDILGWTKPMSAPTRPGQPPVVRPVMAVETVRHVGEAVAVVLARDAYIAEDAAELVQVDYDPLPEVLSIDEALAEGAPCVHPDRTDNIVFRSEHRAGDPDQALAAADHVVSDVFSSARLAAVPMEMRGFLAEYDSGRGALTLRCGVQLPHWHRTVLADLLGLAETKVRIIAPDVGGGFGMKAHVYPEEIVGAALARRFQRPVKWVQDRPDDLMTSTHARDYRFEVTLAFGKDGLIRGLKARIVVDIGAYSSTTTTSGIEAGGAGVFMVGPYKVEHYAYEASSVVSHKTPVGVYRGVAAPICALAIESLIERAAAIIRLDPVEFRRRNLVKPSDLPYRNAIGVVYDTASHVACLERAVALSDFAAFRRTISGTPSADGKLRGIGLACIAEHTGMGSSRMRSRGISSRVPGFDSATMRMEPDGRVIAYVSHATQGQGHETVFAQLIAENLGVDIDHVTVEEGDTAHAPFGTGTVASRGAVSGGGAVIRASRQIAEKLKRLAGEVLEASPGDIELADGAARIVGVPDRSVAITRLAEIAYLISPTMPGKDESFGLYAINYYDPPTASYSNATHVAVVAVDESTGQVAVEGYWVVHDCGRLINPMIVDGQIQGGVAQGLGEALMEAIEFSEEGQPLTATLLDYVLPTSVDVPDIVIEHIETPSTTTEGGIKGAGEGGVIGAVPAIALAVGDALRRYRPVINRVPLTLKAMHDLMRKGTAAGGGAR